MKRLNPLRRLIDLFKRSKKTDHSNNHNYTILVDSFEKKVYSQ